MKKRSAMAIAAGLVAAMLVGVVALSIGLSGTQTADAKGERVQPRVRTVHRTVKIHREAKPEAPKTVTVVTASTSSPSSSSSSESSGSDDQYENEGSDDSFENESESEDSGSSGSGSGSGFEDSGGSDD